MIGCDLFLSLFENRAIFAEKATNYTKSLMLPAPNSNFALMLELYNDIQNKFTSKYLEIFKAGSYLWSNLVSIKYYLSVVRIIAYDQIDYVKFDS